MCWDSMWCHCNGLSPNPFLWWNHGCRVSLWMPEFPVLSGFPAQGTDIREAFPCHDVIMTRSANPCYVVKSWLQRSETLRVPGMDLITLYVNLIFRFHSLHLIHICVASLQDSEAYIKTLWLRQNGSHFADDIFKCFSLNGSFWILLEFHWNMFLMV